jgi:hypothetical protein
MKSYQQNYNQIKYMFKAFYYDKWCKFSKDVARAYGKSFSKLINANE